MAVRMDRSLEFAFGFSFLFNFNFQKGNLDFNKKDASKKEHKSQDMKRNAPLVDARIDTVDISV